MPNCHLYLLLLTCLLGAAPSRCQQQRNYTNPIIYPDAPDPGVLLFGGSYWMVTTTDLNSDEDKLPLHVAGYHLDSWSFGGYVFPRGSKPAWAVSDFWAPELHLVAGQFLVYYSARDTTGMLCIGVAYANNPLGPYTDHGGPILRNSSVGYIDATYFLDPVSNKPYIIWKEDSNDPKHKQPHTPIWAAELSPDGFTVVGEKTMLIWNDQPWEGELVEGPWVLKRNNLYYLFYSANGYCSVNYAIGVARASTLLGPYEKAPSNPFMRSNAAFAGPGHCSVVQTNTSDIMFYHAWPKKPSPLCGPDRVALMDPLHWSADGWPSVTDGSPSFTPQPLPA